jgi:two-component system, cell cycle sensor histidine kinase and response regulator CckA
MLLDILDGIRTAVFVVDRFGTCVYLNRECTSLTGYTLDDAAASQEPWCQVYTIIAEKAQGSGDFAPLTRPVVDRVIPFVCRDGQMRTFRVRVSTRTDGTRVVTLLDTPALVSMTEDTSVTSQADFFDRMPAPVVFFDGKGTVLGQNIAFTRLLIPKESGQNESDGLTQQDREASARFVRKILYDVERESREDRVWTFDRADGTTIGVESRVWEVSGGERETRSYAALVRETSKGAPADTFAGRADADFKGLPKELLALLGVYVVQDNLFTFVNDRFAEICGYDVDQIVNRMKLPDLVLVDDWPALSGQLGHERGQHEKLLCVEFRVTRRDGVTIYLESFGSSALFEGKPAFVGTILDISNHKATEEKLRKAEEKYRSIFENSVLGIFQISSDGRFISANKAAATIHGYNSPEDLVSQVSDIGNQFYVDQGRRKDFLDLMRKAGSVENFEAEMKKEDGSTNWVSINARAVKDENNRTLYFEGTIQEISERKKLESQLLQSQKMEAIGTLAGGVAHDFNNLLMGIQGYTSIMLFNMDPEHEHYEKLKNIEQLVRNGADLTKQLLGFARAGRYQIKVTDLREILSSVASAFIRTKKEITVHERYDRDLYRVEVDQSQIETAFLNLFVNAWQAMPGGGHLYIEAKNVVLGEDYPRLQSMRPGKYVKVSVTDTGVGMDEKTMERIFEPFFTTKEMGRGTGLGLASVYGIVKGHKGIINCYSQLGHGTTFNIYFSSAAGEEDDHADSDLEHLPRGTETILLVDDEEMIVRVGEPMIKALGYDVIVAHGGLEAIDLFAKNRDRIGAVILDLIMPDLEGGKTFDALKRIDTNVKVILSSGYSLNSEAENIMKRGCNAFMQKPFNVYKLSTTLRDVLDNGTIR